MKQLHELYGPVATLDRTVHYRSSSEIFIRRTNGIELYALIVRIPIQ